MMAEANFLAFLLLVIIFVKWLYDKYQDFNTRIEVHFVMVNDPDCCNAYVRSSVKCNSKYCKIKLMKKMQREIESARKSIDIAMYTFSNRQLLNSILNAYRRRVKVRIIMDKSVLVERADSMDGFGDIMTLKQAGIDIRMAGEEKKLMHNKFCLIDAASSNGLVINGSSNWTHSGIRENCENITFISNKRIQTEYAAAFNNIWKNISSPLMHQTDILIESDQKKNLSLKLNQQRKTFILTRPLKQREIKFQNPLFSW